MPLHVHEECNNGPNGNCGRTCNYCCLDVCRVCGTYEGSLTIDCPGYRIKWDTAGDVSFGIINYTDERGWFRDYLSLRGSNFEKDKYGKVLSRKEFPSQITNSYRGEIASLYISLCLKSLTFSDAVIMICNPHDKLSFESINQMIMSDEVKNQLADKTCFVCGLAPRDQVVTFIESTPFSAKTSELRAAQGLCVIVFDSGVVEIHENVDKLIA